MNKISGFFLSLCVALSGTLCGQNLYDIATVRTGYLNFYDANWQTILDSFKTNGLEDRVLADLTVDGILMDSVGVRFKGNSSYNSSGVKKPFNVKIDYVKKQDLYGYTTLKLNNIFKDPSCVREALSYEMLRNYAPASRANYMQLYVDGSLHGLYTSIESVNDDFTLLHFGSNNGSFFKCDPIFGAPPPMSCPPSGPGKASLVDQGTDTTCYKTSYNIESATGWVELVNLIQVLNNNFTQIEEVLDVDRALWMLAFNNVFVNFDSYTGSGHNYYVYENEYGVFNTVTWDLNENFGGFTNGGGQPPSSLSVSQMQTLTPYWNESSSIHPLISRLLGDANYKKRYMAHYRTILDEFVANNAMKNRAVQLQTLINPYVMADPNLFYGYPAFQNGLNQSPAGIVGINVLMDARYTYLSSNAEVLKTGPSISGIQQTPPAPSALDPVWITAQIGSATGAWLHYKTALHAPYVTAAMYDDGLHNDGASGDGTFGGMIPAQSPAATVYYYLYADNSSAGRFSPSRAAYEYYTYSVQGVQLSYGELVINELMASNASTVTDQDGEYNDWIELYNNTASSISLNNMFLSDDAADPFKWRFPDTSIGANGYIIIWADNDLQAGLHSSFKLSASGEQLVLSNSDGTRLDSVTFALQTADLTTGRYPNGTGGFQELSPTFSASNSLLGTDAPGETAPGFSVYPNPAQDQFTVEVTGSWIDKTHLADELEIYNAMMQQVAFKSAQSGNGRLVVATGDHPAGIYFLKLGGQSQKFVVAR